jgi:hypothetical protein
MNPTIAFLNDIGDRPFTIKGYQRTDGSVVNLKLRLLPPDGYKQLARESLECIDKIGELLELTQYEAVRDVVLATLQRTLAEPPTEPAPAVRQSNEDLQFISRGQAMLDGNPDKLVLFNLEILAEEVLVAPAKVVKSRDELSANKKKLTAALPVGRYCFRLNLYPGKYQSIE